MVLVDAHAHLRGCFDVVAFLGGALANFVREARSIDEKDAVTGVLCLVDPPQEKGFERLSRFVAGRGGGVISEGWSCQKTAEEASLHLRLSPNRSLIVVAGRQIESRERLEVLAVGTRRYFSSGIRVDRLIREIDNAGGVPILPWGFGKWFGARGRYIGHVIQDPDLPQFFLGDSAQRPRFWPEPSYFRQAEKHGIRNLPGSDPLPFPKEVDRVGSFGLMLKGGIDPNRPAHDLRRKLLGTSSPTRPFGNRINLLRFVQNQALMQSRAWIHA